MSTTATTACSMCHGSGYTVAGTPCSCGSLANRLTNSNKSDQAHLALLRAELAILRAELRAAEKDRDTWKLRARRMLREDSRFAVIREQESKLTEQAAQIEALEKDAARLDWFERMFVHSWNGVIGTGSLTHWVLAGDYRHQVAKMQGRLFRAAIDAAILGDSHVR